MSGKAIAIASIIAFAIGVIALVLVLGREKSAGDVTYWTCPKTPAAGGGRCIPLPPGTTNRQFKGNTGRVKCDATCPPPLPPNTKPEVYYAQSVGGVASTKGDAAAHAAILGGTLATWAQLDAAQKAGAQWCAGGWNEHLGGSGCYYPMQAKVPGCGTGAGIQTFANGKVPGQKCGVNVYGIKPSSPAGVPVGFSIAPFSATKWSKYSA